MIAIRVFANALRSAGLVEVARRRGAELGLQNVDYRVMDAERIATTD